MNVIIDTHIFLWALTEPLKIANDKLFVLEDLSNTIFVSAVSIAELMIKASLNKLNINFNPVAIAEESGFALLDFNADAALLLKDMPFHHKDPFDRMLISQSIAFDYPIMTEDPKIKMYECCVI